MFSPSFAHFPIELSVFLLLIYRIHLHILDMILKYFYRTVSAKSWYQRTSVFEQIELRGKVIADEPLPSGCWYNDRTSSIGPIPFNKILCCVSQKIGENCIIQTKYLHRRELYLQLHLEPKSHMHTCIHMKPNDWDITRIWTPKIFRSKGWIIQEDPVLITINSQPQDPIVRTYPTNTSTYLFPLTS